MLEKIEEIEETKIIRALDSIELPNLGDVINAKIIKFDENGVVVNIGLKTEGLIPINEFSRRSIPKSFNVNSEIPVIVKQLNYRDGYHIVSYREAKKRLILDRLEKLQNTQEIIQCDVIARQKKGYLVDIGVNAFLPDSEIDFKAFKGLDKLSGETISVVIIKVTSDKKITVSHRKALEIEKRIKKEQLFSTIKEGDIVKGIVTGVTNFGAFVDIDGAEGLIHISELAWFRIKNIHEVIKQGDIVEAKVIKVDKENEKISLSLKQLQPHPWESVEQKYHVGNVVKGKVTAITHYGVFLELEPGVDALLHKSEVSWTKIPEDLREMFNVDQEIDIIITSINAEKKEISVSLKRLRPNPWEEFKSKYPVGSRIECVVSRVVPFGAFVKLENDLEGLIHISDISWFERIKNPREKLSEGDKITAVVMDIDVEEQKITLSIKHLTENPFKRYKVGDTVKCQITKITNSGVYAKLDEQTMAFIPANEISIEKEVTPQALFNIGDTVEAKVIVSDEQKRKLELSIKRLEIEHQEKLKELYSKPPEIKLKDVLEEK